MRSRALFGVCAIGLALGCAGSTGSPRSGDDDDPVGDDAPEDDAPDGEGGSGGSGGGSGPGGGGGSGTGGKPVIVPGEGETGFSCAVGSVPLTPRLRRLTGTQFRNTVRGLLDQSLGDEGRNVYAEIAAVVGVFPEDARTQVPQDPHGAYRRMDQDVLSDHVEATYRVGAAMADTMTTPARLGRLLGACATDADAGNDERCIDDFVRSFGERAFRRPLSDSERTFYRGFYGDKKTVDAVAVGDVIIGLVTAPRFLYLIEEGTGAAGNVVDLSAWELAARLSYQFWQTMPDEALFAAARSGELLKQEGLAREVDRLLASPRARETIDEFFGDYLKLEDLGYLDRTDDFRFRVFAGEDLPRPETRANMIRDALDLSRYVTWTRKARFDELLTDEHAFARTDDVAKIYKVARWNGTSEPPTFPAGQRPGILTRGAIVASGLASTRPIMKGVFIRKSILCDEIPAPPAGASNTPVNVSVRTSRGAVEAITEQAGSSCVDCHKTLINPLGFLTENFDGIGRFRTEEMVIDGNSGEIKARRPVTTAAIPRVKLDDERMAKDAKDLVGFILESKKAHACFARQYFRFTYGRWEQLGDDGVAPEDGCVIERLRKAAEGKPIVDVLREVALAPEFRKRRSP